jgi:hypothetical protein
MAVSEIIRGLSSANCLKTKGTTPRVIPTNALTFSYAESGTDTFIKKQVQGKQQDQQSLGAVLERRLTIVTEFTNFEMYGVMLNAEEKQFANITQPEYSEYVVPAGGGNIPIAAITATNIASVSVCYNGNIVGKRGAFSKVTVAPTTAGTCQVAAGGITFSAADAGLTVGVIVDIAYATAKGYGGAGTAATLGEMEFIGQTFMAGTNKPGGWIYFPQIERLSEVTVELTGDGAAQISQVFNCTIPEALGWDRAFRMITDITV